MPRMDTSAVLSACFHVTVGASIVSSTGFPNASDPVILYFIFLSLCLACSAVEPEVGVEAASNASECTVSL